MFFIFPNKKQRRIMNIIYEQNGGSERYYVSEDNEEHNEENVIPVLHNTRSFFVWVVSEDQYTKLRNIEKYDSGIKVELFEPGTEINFKNELITTDDYNYPDKTLCNSSCFTDDIIEEYVPDINTYRVVGIDLIWCRENLLSAV